MSSPRPWHMLSPWSAPPSVRPLCLHWALPTFPAFFKYCQWVELGSDQGFSYPLKNTFSRTTTNGSFELQLCFQVFVISQSGQLEYHSNKSRLRKFEWLAGGENAWLSTARFKIETRCGCFYITVFLKENDCLQKILDVIFISSCMYCNVW